MRSLYIMAIQILVIAATCADCSRRPEPEHRVGATRQGAVELCRHLRDLGCEQRTACEDERLHHLATRDMRIDCLMAAQSVAAVERCGTVQCPARSP